MFRIVLFSFLFDLSFGYKFQYLSYDEMNEKMIYLCEKSNKFCELFSIQKKYDIPSPGNCGITECESLVMKIYDKSKFFILIYNSYFFIK